MLYFSVVIFFLLMNLLTIAKCSSFGVNLSPLGGNIMGYSFDSWDYLSTYVFTNIYKHCSPLYIRSTYNGGNQFNWQSNTQVKWRRDGYPMSLPYTSSSNYWAAICDIGMGGNNIANGTYSVFWDGSGDVSFPSSVATILQYNRNIGFASIRIRIGANSGLNVRIIRTNSTNPVRNVRIVPAAFASNYTSQIFQPQFLSIIKPFNHIRFTGWQKISTSSKSWLTRTLPSSQTQNGYDGVAIEHMLDLIRITKVPSVWFSFPLQSASYNYNMTLLLASGLADSSHNITIYYDAGSAEISTDSDRHVESLNLFAIFNQVIANNKSLDHITLMPTASVTNYQYAPYLISRFGSALSQVKAVGVPAQFGKSANGWDHYDSAGQWDLTYADWTPTQLIEELRTSSLVSEQALNTMRQVIIAANPNIQFVAFTGGPALTAFTYGYRAALNTAKNCISKNTFPCTWANTRMNLLNQTAAAAAMPALVANASLEQKVQNSLISLVRDPRVTDIYMDFLERWKRIGGGLFTSAPLVQPVVSCPTGGGGCGNGGMFESPAFAAACAATGCPLYTPIVKYYNQGLKSALPFTSADLPPPLAVRMAASCAQPCRWGTCFNGTCACFAGYNGPTCSVRSSGSVTKPNDCNNDTGINLAGIADWSTEWPFVDLFKTSRAWISQSFTFGTPWSMSTPQALLPNGYPQSLVPTQKLSTIMARDVHGHMRAGKFVCLYDGDGILNFGMDVIAYKRGVGRIELTVQPSTGLNNGIFLMIERTNPADPIRNIRILFPGFESSYVSFPFHPLFLKTTQSYNTFRFMDWGNTNGVINGNWSGRTTPATACTYASSSGVAIEQMILLANTQGTNAWFNMPHTATDDYLWQFANLTKALLRPDVKIYVEYSNEVWGTLFPGGIYAQQQGLLRGLSTNPGTARFCFYMQRIAKIESIWQKVFTGSSKKRVFFVINSQAVNPDVSRQLIACPAFASFDRTQTVLAIAPYFGTYNPSTMKNLDVFINTTLPNQIASMTTQVLGHLKYAKWHNMTLVTYESGQGLQGSGTANDLAIQANRDPRMTGLYMQYFNMLRKSGVKLMMQYTSAGTYSTSATWGLLESTDQNPQSSPKYQGLQAYIAQHATCSASSVAAVSSVIQPTCPRSCSYSGACVTTPTRLANNSYCECYYGSSGSACEVTSYTEHVDLCGYKCGFDQGTCLPSYIAGNDRYWACSCNAPYFGPQCQLFTCQQSCNYNGQCLDADVCSCYPGYSGKFCDFDCGCGGHGSCITPSVGIGQQTCLCDIGYVWSSTSKSCVVDNQAPTCSPSCKYGSCVDGSCVCWAGYYGSSCTLPTYKPNQNSLIGTTLSGISYYAPEWTFVDVMKMTSDWVSLDAPGWTGNYAWGNGMKLSIGPNGYPTRLQPGQIAVKLVQRNVQFHAPSGRYVCLYDGDGLIGFSFDATVLTRSKGRVEFYFTPSWKVGCTDAYCGDNGILLQLLVTNPLNPVSNIRIIMPGFEQTYAQLPFHPYYLKNIEHYSVLRFMGWQNINNNDLEINWVDRTSPGNATQTNAALESMIALSNQIGASPWFCIPHKATDDYVLQFAKLVKATLRPDVKVYIEYSNEVWNGLFSQAVYAQSRGLALGLSTNPATAQYRFYSQRSVQIFAIFESVFAGTGVKLVKILSTWTISPSATQTILSWKNASQYATVVAVAPYFDCGSLGSPGNIGTTAVMSIPQVLAACMNKMSSISTMVGGITAMASKYGLPVMTYESGQSLVETAVMEWGNSPTPAITNLFIGANRDPGMTAVYVKYINTLIASGIVTSAYPMMHFASCGLPSKYGSWGAIEYTGQVLSTAPKYLALRQYFNTTATPSTAAPAAAINATTTSLLALGVGDFSYMGYPAVTAPRMGDVWFANNSQVGTWDTAGVNPTATVGLYLWKGSYRNPSITSTLVRPIKASMLQSKGSLTFFLPTSDSFDGASSYFVEIRGAQYSNFSEFFSVKSSSYFYQSAQFHCCYGEQKPQYGPCLLATSPTYHTPLLLNSSWVANKFSCGSLPNFVTRSCSVDQYGTRTYWTQATNKPVTDNTAQTSPYPSVANFTWGPSGKPVSSYFCAAFDDTVFTSPPSPDCSMSVGASDSFCSPYAPTAAPIPGRSQLPTAIPTKSPTSVPSTVPTVKPTPTPVTRPTVEPSTTPTRTPTVTPTDKPVAAPSPSPSRIPSASPSACPTRVPSNIPTVIPSPSPTTKPTAVPSTSPSRIPTNDPTYKPSAIPTASPSQKPSAIPSVYPTRAPSTEPSTRPSSPPTVVPSKAPTAAPSSKPTFSPTYKPSAIISAPPTERPSATPSLKPLEIPTLAPSPKPIPEPSTKPTASPTPVPSLRPSVAPTPKPSVKPTVAPVAKSMGTSPSSAVSTSTTPGKQGKPTVV